MFIQNNSSSVTTKRSNPALRQEGKCSGPVGVFTICLWRFLALFAIWLLLSGMYDLFHITLGAIASAFITWLFTDIFPPSATCLMTGRGFTRLLVYLPWLIFQITKANLWMLYLVFHPKLYEKISPRVFTFQTSLKTDIGLTMLANSITLTPGTITAGIDEHGCVSVHAIDDYSAAGVGEMDRRIVGIVGGE